MREVYLGITPGRKCDGIKAIKSGGRGSNFVQIDMVSKHKNIFLSINATRMTLVIDFYFLLSSIPGNGTLY